MSLSLNVKGNAKGTRVLNEGFMTAGTEIYEKIEWFSVYDKRAGSVFSIVPFIKTLVQYLEYQEIL